MGRHRIRYTTSFEHKLEPISKLIYSVYTSLSPFSNAGTRSGRLRVNCAFRKALASSKRKISNYEIGSSKIKEPKKSRCLQRLFYWYPRACGRVLVMCNCLRCNLGSSPGNTNMPSALVQRPVKALYVML